ncbi:disulfide bond formation protein DsbA [Rhizobium anhuiense]|uniref:Disulfide bond formation protein DsbA n=1 Tax=Rhizobium anhuiense TaxID=1184720 RepID=A0ABX4J5N9_9HYPH|nr:DsbA family oxidoreductase [Rhizobium anhuiense]PDS41199.1 disulfide bond formation protein DsbA [Rhizobium anhuiense]PDS49659.1 disulfide bond formation protein DsbA [Rhizobium anhuiense]
MRKVHVEVWSDFVCPWCWIAKRRFEKAVASLAGKVEVVVTNKAYRLARGMAPMDYQTALYKKLGSSVGADRMMAAVRGQGLEESLVYNFDTMLFGDTTAAHALIKSIGLPVVAQLMSERLYKAVTTDGLDIFDQDVLATLARQVGVSDTLDFDPGRAASEIARDEAEANSIANGVPLFLLNGKTFLSGARETVVFEKALRDAAIDVPAALDESEGESCGIGGCH